MNKIEYDGKVDEQDLWRLFTDAPDQPSETVLFFSQLKPLLKPMKFQEGIDGFLLPHRRPNRSQSSRWLDSKYGSARKRSAAADFEKPISAQLPDPF